MQTSIVAASSAVSYTATSSARPRENWPLVTPLRITCHGIAGGVAPTAPLCAGAPSTYSVAVPPATVSARWCHPSRRLAVGSAVVSVVPPARYATLPALSNARIHPPDDVLSRNTATPDSQKNQPSSVAAPASTDACISSSTPSKRAAVSVSAFSPPRAPRVTPPTNEPGARPV